MPISTYLKTSILFIGASLTACATTSTSTITHTNVQNLQNTYPVASVLKQATINGAEYTYKVVDNDGNIEEELSRTFVNSPIDINNPSLVKFNGQDAIVSDAVVLLATKTNLKYSEKLYYYDPETLQVLGYKVGEQPDYKTLRTVTKQFNVPKMATVGDSALLLEGKTTAWGTSNGNFTYQWRLKKVSTTTANLCVIKSYNNNQDAITEIDTECFTIDQAGSILDKKASFIIASYDGSKLTKYITQ